MPGTHADLTSNARCGGGARQGLAESGGVRCLDTLRIARVERNGRLAVPGGRGRGAGCQRAVAAKLHGSIGAEPKVPPCGLGLVGKGASNIWS